jgi:hypothetical protein
VAIRVVVTAASVILLPSYFYVLRRRHKNKINGKTEKESATSRFQWPEPDDSPTILRAELGDHGIHEMDITPRTEFRGNGRFVHGVKGQIARKCIARQCPGT